MPLPKNSGPASIALLNTMLNYPLDQQSLLHQFKSANKHQLAICFRFPPWFKIHFNHGESQATKYAERVIRLCETVNQPDTIKADIWTHTPNNGTVAGVRPNIQAEGTPVAPEQFLGQLGYVLIAYVQVGSADTTVHSVSEGNVFVVSPVETASKMIGFLNNDPIPTSKPKKVHPKKKVPAPKLKVKPYDPSDDPWF